MCGACRTWSAAQASRAEESPTANHQQRALRILLVEDHEDSAKVLARLLKKMGHEVAIAESVAAGLRTARSQPFDLLISDIGLPDGSGLDLMRQLKDERPLPGIVLSGHGMEQDVQQSREAGVALHLTKPVNFGQLKAAIVTVLRQ